ncbi:alpha/beta-hydrolase family protein [Ruegeria pomeroyi]|nr:alpha/beta-hydrolase family protein [Ruegeria pomeroyi]
MIFVRVLKRFLSSLSVLGMSVGLLFFAASLTPSLIPRTFEIQGVLSGVVLIFGYGLGSAIVWLWSFLELPVIRLFYARGSLAVLFLFCLGLVTLTLSNVTEWQNTLRGLMDMAPVNSAYPFRILGVAIITAIAVLLIWRVFVGIGRWILGYSARILPRRVASIVAVSLVVFATLTIVNNVVLSRALLALDETFAKLNEFIEPDIDQPTSMTVSGGPASFLNWKDIGRRGRQFIVTGPSAEDISDLTGAKSETPLRIYAGFNGEENFDAQAELVLKEMLRLGAFDRSVLITATPTGTGWMDPAAVDTVEFLHGGDTAIVALQYSYLPSWTTLLIDPDRSRRAARALFREVYEHWRTLDPEERPKLYLFGLSLGALGSEHSSNTIELLNDPFDGALWSGPPFPSTYWSQIMNNTDVTGPAWLPILPDDRLVRFMGPEGVRTPSRDGWGRTRILYIQHASDPMSFFSPSLLWSSPRWLTDRGPDVTPDMRWMPFVMFFQVGFDIFLATTVPLGYGHNFAPGAYIDGWLAVTDPEGWDADKVARLKAYFRNRSEAQ